MNAWDLIDGNTLNFTNVPRGFFSRPIVEPPSRPIFDVDNNLVPYSYSPLEEN